MTELATLARPYAKAAFAESVKENDLQSWSDILIFSAQLVENKDVKKILIHPSITAQEQLSVMVGLCGDTLSKSVNNFFAVLAENKRFVLLPEIVKLFELFKAEKEQATDVEITSAYALTDNQQDKLSSSLKNKLQCDVRVTTNIDASLVGGVVIRAGDLVIDGSVRGKLAKLAEAMNS
jgi:F-type H+-transporting ATPase subunit delta